jgi:hypothetical protein
MRFMVLVKATPESESGAAPEEALLTAMTHYNEELVRAGVLLAGEGLHPSSRGKRVRFANGKRTVIDGPFAETKELLAGFWILQLRSFDEAVEWVKRIPFAGETEVEIRQISEIEDFGPELTPEARAREESQRQRIAQANARRDVDPANPRSSS